MFRNYPVEGSYIAAPWYHRSGGPVAHAGDQPYQVFPEGIVKILAVPAGTGPGAGWEGFLFAVRLTGFGGDGQNPADDG